MDTHLEEVLDPLRLITVALPADTLHLLHLASLASSLRTKEKWKVKKSYKELEMTTNLYVLQMDIRVLTEVDDGSEEIKEA